MLKLIYDESAEPIRECDMEATAKSLLRNYKTIHLTNNESLSYKVQNKKFMLCILHTAKNNGINYSNIEVDTGKTKQYPNYTYNIEDWSFGKEYHWFLPAYDDNDVLDLDEFFV
jgi:hypothetical protein